MAIFSGLSALVGGLLGGTFLSGIGGALLKIAVGIGLNLLASAIAGKPPEMKADFGITGQIQTGGDVARSFPVGWTATAGSLAYANAWGTEGKTPNAYFTQVITLSDLPITDLVGVWVNGVKVTLDKDAGTERGWPVKEYRKDGKDYLWVKFRDGTQTAADSFLTGKVSTTENPYGADRIGRGIAYAICTARIHEELFTGFPAYRFEVHGVPLYDPSKDSTVGGSGPQRWANPSTWGGDGDHLPAVQLYNGFRGIRYGGSWFYGLQNMTAARVPVGDWIARINYCRATVSDQIRYRSGGEIAVSAPFSEAVSTILTTCQGRVSEAGGVYKLRMGVDDAPVAIISDADILSTEEQTFSPFFGLADTVNGIAATYPSPAEGWNTKAAPPRYNAQYETEDGGRRLMADVAINFCPYPHQVQRLTLSALKEARRARRHTFVLPPKYWTLEPGDFIRWTSARNGYEDKKFRVDGVVDKPNLDIIVDLTEVDPSDYDWNNDTDYRIETDGRLVRKPPEPQEIVDWGASAASIDDPDGVGRRPAIRLSWDGDVDDVEAVIFEVRVSGTNVVTYRGRTDMVEVGAILIHQGLLPNIYYHARGKYVPRSDRTTTWSGWLPVRTLNIRLGDDDVYLPGMVGEINDLIEDATEWIGETRPLIDNAYRTAMLAFEQDAAQWTDREYSEQIVRSATGAITASYMKAIVAATGPGSALVARVELLEAKIPDLATVTITDALTARIDHTDAGVTALGQALTAVNVSLGTKASTESVLLLSGRITEAEGEISAIADAVIGVSAAADGSDVSTARARFGVTTGPAGYAARIVLEARATGKDGWRTAAAYWDVPNNPSLPATFGVDADRFFVSNGSNRKNPFVFQDGIARLNVAHIGKITAGVLESRNGKMRIDLDAGTIEIWS